MSNPKSDLDLNLYRAVEVFMAVAEMRQVTAAATALGITQSAASQHLKNLETAFNVSLFDRSTRPISLTFAGETFQRHGFRMLNLVEDLRRDIHHLAASSLPVLRVAMLASIATTLTPGLYDLVEHRFRVPELILSAGLASDHQVALNDRRIDIAVTSELIQLTTDYEVIPILDEPFFLVIPVDYDGPVDDVHALSERLSLVRFGASTPVGRRTDQQLQRCRLNLPRAIEADRSSMVMAGVITGKCFAILTPSLLIDGVAEGMALRLAPLPFAEFRRTIKLVCRRDDLGEMPMQIARECRDILQRAFRHRFPDQVDQVLFHEIG